MEPRLIQQQSQKLTLSPQIRQYLRLLQLPLVELEQAVEVEMTENPLLEEKQPLVSMDVDEPSQHTEASAASDKGNETEVRVGEIYERIHDLRESFDEGAHYPDFSRRDRIELEEKRSFQEGLLTKTEGLSDFLLWQIRFLDISEEKKRVAHEIIGNIDDDGYLRASLEELAKAANSDNSTVQHVLSIIQDLDPPGIAARNLQEALLIQLTKLHRDLPPEKAVNGHRKAAAAIALAIRIVSEQLSLLEKRDWTSLARNLSIPVDEVREAAKVIARLEPRPGRTFYSEEALAVTPDATISFNEDRDSTEKFRIEIHDEKIPEIRINPYYRRLIRSKDMDDKAKAYIREKMQSALNFLKALKLRKSTIRAITEQIVLVQPEFLEKGFTHLKPLRLKDIAENLSIHESTVSRAINGKYVLTPQGMISYKSFFSTKLETSDGNSESQKSIMERIRRLIDQEEPSKPLSDQDIVERLKAEGLKIARRTVAKYRELLKILPSHLRRKR